MKTPPRIDSIPITVRAGRDLPVTSGTVEVVTWGAQERSRRALKFLGLCWGIGLFCVIIPILHFILVPGMFIAGLVGFARLSAQEKLIMKGEGKCPACSRNFHIAQAAHRFPMDELCEHCRTSVSIAL